MSRQLVDGVWVLVCDWQDPVTGMSCTFGTDDDGKPNSAPRMTVDPEAGQSTDKHFQCGSHHGVIPQAEKPEFQLPKGHKLNEEVLRPGIEMQGAEVEEIDDGK